MACLRSRAGDLRSGGQSTSMAKHFQTEGLQYRHCHLSRCDANRTSRMVKCHGCCGVAALFENCQG